MNTSREYRGKPSVAFSPVAALRIRIRSISAKRSAATRAMTFEIPGSEPIETIALMSRSRPIDVAAARLEACLHDAKVVRRERRIHRDVHAREDPMQRGPIRDIRLEGRERRRLAERLQRSGAVPSLVDDHDLIDAPVGRELQGDDPSESARPEDRGLHARIEATLRP